jgi:nucleotide-binding universal stress UspA family protein
MPIVVNLPTDDRKPAQKRLEVMATQLIPPELYAGGVVLMGNPARQILATAAKHRIDLIILSTVGRTGLKRILLGSTAEHVVRHSLCPVLTVRRR